MLTQNGTSHCLLARGTRLASYGLVDMSVARQYSPAWIAAPPLLVHGGPSPPHVRCLALSRRAPDQLAIANLGDSGLLVLRHLEAGKLGTLSRPSDGRIVAFRSTQQLHEFNRPYQVRLILKCSFKQCG